MAYAARRIQRRRFGPVCLGRRCVGVPTGYQAVVEAIRREEQPDGCCAMPRRSESCERRLDTDSFTMVEHRTEQQAYVEDCTSML